MIWINPLVQTGGYLSPEVNRKVSDERSRRPSRSRSAVLLGLVGLGAFLWSMTSGQFDDLEGAAYRVLFEEEDEQIDGPESAEVPGTDPAPAKNDGAARPESENRA